MPDFVSMIIFNSPTQLNWFLPRNTKTRAEIKQGTHKVNETSQSEINVIEFSRSHHESASKIYLTI